MKQLAAFLPRVSRAQAAYILVGVLAGVLLMGLVRFALQPDNSVHYHANFAIFIQGQRQQFNGPQYYQEIASCSAAEHPSGRVHMHDNIDHVVHVHQPVTTWANFFSIIGWSLQDAVLSDGKQAYVDGNGGQLQFMLNGKPVLSLANEVITSEDRLLVSFGNENQTALTKQYEQIEADANQYNQRKDPSACKGPEELSVWMRLRRAFWF
jgi:hypothetical protein